MKKIGLILSLLLLTMCGREPEPIAFGEDNCAHCSMMIVNPKFGSELITSKGKVYKFDSIECLIAESKKYNSEDIAVMWVPNFNNDKEFINFENAFLLISDKIKSPMSLNLLAFKSEEELRRVKEEYGGKEISLKGAIDYVQSKW